MKLTELLENQRLTIQLLWGEQKIEFFSYVIEKDDQAVYVSPYIHHGSELELNVTSGKGVICNLYTDNPTTRQRISWKGIELTTVVRKDETLYCLKTNGFNHVAKHDDRRMHDRVIVKVKAKVFDGNTDEGTDIIVHDISDIGISFYAPRSFSPQDHQLTIAFSDSIGEKEFNVKIECMIARMTNRAGNRFIGCKIKKENKDFQLYGFMKRVGDKNRNMIPKSKDDDLQGSIPKESQAES